MSKVFRKSDQLRERAHGDGIQVGYDSPEAFEEVLWRVLWPEKYSRNSVGLWTAGDYQVEAHAFIVDHMKKIVALRKPHTKNSGRYLSKNNANIARLDLIRYMFPEAKILVPIRHPVEHSASLLRQHIRFLKMHKDDPFVRRYMADLGHYEFGELHRPICFPDLNELNEGRSPLDLEYWLGYWISAFEYVLEHRESIILVSHEETCEHPKLALKSICAQLEIEENGMADVASSLFRKPSRPRSVDGEANNELLDRAETLHSTLIMS